jgi:hypothetical protein
METDALIDAVVSHALASGNFENVNQHEPKSSPGHGITAAVWVQHIVPLPQQSGLNATAGRILFQVRLYSNMLAKEEDQIDPNLIKACDDLMEAYSGDFTLDGLVNSIDLLGRHGVPLSAQSGYMQVERGWYRILDIDVPLILDDIWSQNP